MYIVKQHDTLMKSCLTYYKYQFILLFYLSLDDIFVRAALDKPLRYKIKQSSIIPS